ncbi:MAG TPA: ATP-dependent DNA ligase [Steroidobacteraceae bacterium]|jgi:DNA ligase-1|nr:ATP-dependent DNA ligase [Steroidobacteraceae bacterium]
MTLLANLVGASGRVQATRSRLSKVRELAAFLQTLSADEVAIGALYLSGATPQGRSGVGYAALRAAAATLPAQTSSLSLVHTDAALSALATVRGAGSGATRARNLEQLFAQATRSEQEFLLPLLAGELRQGALGAVMLDAIAAASGIPLNQLRRAAMHSTDLGALARVALLEGVEGLGRFRLELFAPVAPMLAQTAGDVAEALTELGGEVIFEWKMDGARIQVHKRGAEVRIYTRALNEITAALPEVVERVRVLAPRELLLDGEAIAFDAHDRPLPFQTTMRRFGRKLDVEQMRTTLPMRAYFFDCLLLEGASLTDRSTRERFEALASAVPADARVPRLVTSSSAAAASFYEAAIAAGHEGVMAKSGDSIYEAGNRGASWLKIKRVHTLDLVVLAAEWGNGRRVGKLSNLHLGAWDAAGSQFVMLGKTFKGLTDALLAWQTRELLARETHREGHIVYVRPELVVEIAFSDLQASSRYPGGMALRLARVKRYREDKPIAEADTMESVRRIFALQTGAVAPD